MVKLIARINLFLVKGAFFVTTEEDKGDEGSRRECNGTDDIYSQKLPNTGRLSEESPICYPMARISLQGPESRCDSGHNFLVPSTVLQLTFELLTVIDCWLAGSSVVSHGSSGVSHCKEASAAVEKMQCILRSCDGSLKLNEHRLTSMKDTGLFSENDVFLLLSSPDWSDNDVSSQEIPIHMPLHGLLSLILIEAMRNYHGELVIADQCGSGTDLDPLNPLVSCNHGIFDDILRGCHPKGFSFFIMEHPLQRRVFCSQVCAGMWDKSSNGNTAEVCHELLYSNCWTHQELEIDLFVLQLCAAYAPADLYIKRMIQRFQLSSYLDLDFRRSDEYEPVLVQELLTLIIQIIKERQFCGLTAAESLQIQLVCKLASGDASHVQLLKSISVDLRKPDQFQKIVDEIAEKNQGKYSLRSPYWSEFDMYHPCWNPRDLAAAKERYTRLCRVSALGAQVPRWSRTYKSFTGIAKIPTCKTTVNLIRAVLFYAMFTDTSVESRAPDGVLVRAMHLLSLALDICSVSRHCSSPFMVIATEEIEMGIHGRQSLLSLVVLLAQGSKIGNCNVSFLAKTVLDKFDKLYTKSA